MIRLRIIASLRQNPLPFERKSKLMRMIKTTIIIIFRLFKADTNIDEGEDDPSTLEYSFKKIVADSACRWYRTLAKKTYFYYTKNSPKCCTNSYFFVLLLHYSIDRLQLISLFCDEKSTKAKSRRLCLFALWIAFTLTPSLQRFSRFFLFFFSFLSSAAAI